EFERAIEIGVLTIAEWFPKRCSRVGARSGRWRNGIGPTPKRRATDGPDARECSPASAQATARMEGRRTPGRRWRKSCGGRGALRLSLSGSSSELKLVPGHLALVHQRGPHHEFRDSKVLRC